MGDTIAALPLEVRAPEIGRLLHSIRTEIEQPDGSWNGGDVVELLTTWFTALGFDVEAPVLGREDDGSDDGEPSYEGYAKHADGSVYSVQCSEGRHRACPQGPDDDETGLPPGGPMFDGCYCECSCGHERG